MRLIILSFILLTNFYLQGQVVPNYKYSGIFYTYEDFKNGKMQSRKYKNHSDAVANFAKGDYGKKFYTTVDIWALVTTDGHLYVTNKMNPKRFIKVLLEGEIIFVRGWIYH